MSTFYEKTVQCSCCGQIVTEIQIGSTNSLGECDLDTRPAPMARWTMDKWIQVCPQCGFVAPSLDVKCKNIANFIKSKKYIECDNIKTENELAIKFIRWGLICKEEHDKTSEMMAYLHAAWSCDDSNDVEAAKQLRIKCELVLEQLMKQDEREELRLLDADLLRRSAQFDEVIRKYSSNYALHENISKALQFEVKAAKEHDVKRYEFSSTGVYGEK